MRTHSTTRFVYAVFLVLIVLMLGMSQPVAANEHTSNDAEAPASESSNGTNEGSPDETSDGSSDEGTDGSSDESIDAASATGDSEPVEYEPLTSNQIPGLTDQTGAVDIGDYFSGLFTAVISITTVLAVIMITFAGIKWLTAGGNTSKVDQAKSHLQGAIGGLLLAAASWLILYTINPAILNFQLNTEEIEQSDLCDPVKNEPFPTDSGYYLSVTTNYPDDAQQCAGELLLQEYKEMPSVLCRYYSECNVTEGSSFDRDVYWDCQTAMDDLKNRLKVPTADLDRTMISCISVEDEESRLPPPGFYLRNDAGDGFLGLTGSEDTAHIPYTQYFFQEYRPNGRIDSIYIGPYGNGIECHTASDTGLLSVEVYADALASGNIRDNLMRIEYLGCRTISGPDNNQTPYEIINPEWYADDVDLAEVVPDHRDGTSFYRKIDIDQDTEWFGPYRTPEVCESQETEDHARASSTDKYPGHDIDIEECFPDYEAADISGDPIYNVIWERQ